MLVFIDESGIHKSVDHSTFVVVYVAVKNIGALETTVINIEQKLLIDHFHWAEAVWDVKRKFIEAVLPLDFEVKIAVVHNPINPGNEMERVLSHLLIEHQIQHVYIDGKKQKWYERKLKKILRDKLIPIKKLSTVRSESCPGVRVADMVAGIVRWHYDGKNPEKIERYYEKLKKKIILTIG